MVKSFVQPQQEHKAFRAGKLFTINLGTPLLNLSTLALRVCMQIALQLYFSFLFPLWQFCKFFKDTGLTVGFCVLGASTVLPTEQPSINICWVNKFLRKGAFTQCTLFRGKNCKYFQMKYVLANSSGVKKHIKGCGAAKMNISWGPHSHRP